MFPLVQVELMNLMPGNWNNNEKKNFSKPFQLGKIFFIKYICIMNLTDFRKTMETGVDPRLPIMLFCLVTVFSLVIVRVKS